MSKKFVVLVTLVAATAFAALAEDEQVEIKAYPMLSECGDVTDLKAYPMLSEQGENTELKAYPMLGEEGVVDTQQHAPWR